MRRKRRFLSRYRSRFGRKLRAAFRRITKRRAHRIPRGGYSL